MRTRTALGRRWRAEAVAPVATIAKVLQVSRQSHPGACDVGPAAAVRARVKPHSRSSRATFLRFTTNPARRARAQTLR